MNRPTRELLFDGVILLAVGLAQSSFLFGIGVEPYLTLAIGSVLVGGGVATIVPPRTRVSAAVTGLIGMMLAGGVVPIFAARAVRLGTTLWASLMLAGAVLSLTFAILRFTTFRSRSTQPI